jgi:hypothetical protein
MNPIRIALLVLASIGATCLVVFFGQQLKTVLHTGIVRPTHGRIDRRTQPREFWLYVGWLIGLITCLIAFIPLALLVALGVLEI